MRDTKKYLLVKSFLRGRREILCALLDRLKRESLLTITDVKRIEIKKSFESDLFEF